MHTVIRKTAGGDLAEMESVLARLLDAMLMARTADVRRRHRAEGPRRI